MVTSSNIFFVALILRSFLAALSATVNATLNPPGPLAQAA